MAAIVGTNVGSIIVPTDTADTYPTHDQQYGKGGWMSVADTTARDAIPALRRVEGMIVYIVSDEKEYQLVNGITNSDWVEYVQGDNVWTKSSGTLTQLTTSIERVYIGSDTSRIDMTAAAGIDMHTDGVLRVNADTTFSGNIVSRGFQLVEGDSYQQVVIKSTSHTGGLLLQATGTNAGVTINAADAGGSVGLTRYGNQTAISCGADATVRAYDAVQLRGPYTSVGTDGTSLLVPDVVLQVVGAQYIQQNSAGNVGLMVQNVTAGGPVATFVDVGTQAIFKIDATRVTTKEFYFYDSIILGGSDRYAEGGSSGSPLAVPMAGHNRINIQPTTDSYYALGAPYQAGQIVTVINESAQTPYLSGAISLYLGYVRPSPWSAVMLIADSSGNWTPVK